PAGSPANPSRPQGKRAGLAPGTTPGLWSHMAAAIDAANSARGHRERPRAALHSNGVLPLRAATALGLFTDREERCRIVVSKRTACRPSPLGRESRQSRCVGVAPGRTALIVLTAHIR